MDPEQDTKMPADGSEGQKSDGQSPMSEHSSSKRKKTWLWIIIILLILLLLFLGWWWWKDKDKKTSTTGSATGGSSEQQKQTEKTATCASGFSEYTNTELGFGFCYPTTWGTVSVADAKFAAADTGQRWTVKFASKPMVNLGVVTADWSTTVPRDGTCVDPAVQTLPAFSPFSTTWETEGTPVMSATRGIDVLTDTYLIDEQVDDVLTSGACLHGYTIINADPYTHTSASYSAEFGGAVTTPQQHIDNPNVLISEANRNDFYTFVKSVHKL